MINKKHIRRPLIDAWRRGREPVRYLFAQAIGDTDLFYVDEPAAHAAGYRSLLVGVGTGEKPCK